MSIAELSIRRPVTAVMLFVSLFVIGLIAALRLPLEAFPDVSPPFIFVQLPYSGSTPEEVERTVLRPVEEAISTMPGIKRMDSSARADGANVFLQFSDWDRDVAIAASEARERIDAIRDDLPAGPITYTNLALPYQTTLDGAYQFNAVNVDASKLLPGTNVLAEELHLLNPSLSSAGFDLELIGTGIETPPSLSLMAAGTNLVFSWPADGGGAFSLYSNTNLASADWTLTVPAAQTNGSQLIVTQSFDAGAKFFRLQKP